MRLVAIVESRNAAVRAVLHAGWSIGRRHLLASTELREARLTTKPDGFLGGHWQLLLSPFRPLANLGLHCHRLDKFRPASVLGTSGPRVRLLDFRPSWGEEKRERSRLWPTKDATAWTTAGLTWHIVGTCVRSDLRSLRCLSYGAPLRELTTCATLLTAVYPRLRRLSGDFSNKWSPPQGGRGKEPRWLEHIDSTDCGVWRTPGI